ncbi:hypothetical protein [Mucilaginibacter sp.]|uniref:hypothetical protein n=1 Tax=Mucilaginibacter sp. TaxID=1882438 RepID=UPI0025FB350D|nr:hypothetical protein [Mucilaginibacter sp.]
MKRIDNLFLLLAAIVLLASSCGEDGGVKLQGTTGAQHVIGPAGIFSHSSSAGGKINIMPYRPRLGQFISARFTADNSNSAALSTLLAVERTKHVDMSV